MCDKCFNAEIKSFPTQAEFEAFDLVLIMKAINDKTIRNKKRRYNQY